MKPNLCTTLVLLVVAATLPRPAGADTATTAALTGAVTGPDGKPAAAVDVGIVHAPAAGERAAPRRSAGPTSRIRTDANGRFTFANLAPGEYLIMASAGSARGMARVTIEAGKEADLNISLREGGQAPATRPARNRQRQPAGQGDRDGAFNTRPAPGERYATRLRVGDDAPDFTLPTPDQKSEITLSASKGKKPVILVFGSFSCPPFRDRVLQIEKLSQTWKDQADFVMVYIREAHPDSVIRVREDGNDILKKIEQTHDLAARSRNAQTCTASLKLTFPAVVDREDNKINAAYAGWPSRIIAIDEQGKVAFDGGQGPGGFQPAQLEAWLKANAQSNKAAK